MSSYGNIKNQNDLESRKRQHAETLQLMIENEGIKQKKLADYKNPNKPPPVPPQYKTADEITKDVMQQEKLLLDNVKELGLDSQQSIGFLQLIKNKTGGVDNIVKLNRNYPSFKKSVLEGYNPKALTSQLLANIYDEFVTDLDTVTGLRNANPKATSFYNPVTGNPIEDYVTIEILSNLKKVIETIQGDALLVDIQADGLARIQFLLDKFIENSPSYKDMIYLNSLLPLEERQMKNLISTRVNRTNIPTNTQLAKTLSSISAILSKAGDPDEKVDKLIPLLSVLSKQLSYIESEDTVKAMQEILAKIRSYALDFQKVGVDLGTDAAEREKFKKEVQKEIAPTEEQLKEPKQVDLSTKGTKPELIKKIIASDLWKIFKGKDLNGEEVSYADYPMSDIDRFTNPPTEAEIADIVEYLKSYKKDQLKRFLEDFKTFKKPDYFGEADPRNLDLANFVNDRIVDELLILNNINFRESNKRQILAQILSDPNFDMKFNKFSSALKREIRGSFIADDIEGMLGVLETQNEPIVSRDFLTAQGVDISKFKDVATSFYFLNKGIAPSDTRGRVTLLEAENTKETAKPAIVGELTRRAATKKKVEDFTRIAEFVVGKVGRLTKPECVDRLISLRNNFPEYKAFITKAGGKQKSRKELMKTDFEILKELIRQVEIDGSLSRRIDAGYDPEDEPATALDPIQGFGMREKLQKIQDQQPKYRLFGQGAKEPKPPDTIHIDINSHNGRDYKAGEGGFMHRKIKIGKGITAVERPRYEKFGKYTIHMPQLINESVLNVKYQSLGGVPSLKPTVITDNYRDFILNTLETGKVNNREFDTLANTEKEHFTKIAKGAGLIETLKIKNSPTIDHTEDIQRFNLLKGEFDAGNNNEKLIKELKGLVMKFISLGKLNKKLGLEFLMQLNLV